MNPPLGIIAEITHRCPLHCVYCSNPIELAARQNELLTKDWISVFQQAAEMGALQLFLSGGEPLARHDLAELVRGARQAKLYVNLITSGIGLNEQNLEELVRAGLDHIQLSFQDSRAETADKIAGTRAHTHKLAICREIGKQSVAFTVNAVVHRQNLEHLPAIIALAEELGASKLEIAHVQYYGWALRNRDYLLPTRQQLEESQSITQSAQQRLAGKMLIEFVLPDYYAKYPKACMGGWGQKMMVINPAGRVLPCHAAEVISGLEFANAKDHSLQWIWEQSPAFNRFRGEAWMQEPCSTCDRRARDFGGCRCQAFLLSGDATATDPVCSLSPRRPQVDSILSQIKDPSASWMYRENAN